jgi:hypothetical protein
MASFEGVKVGDELVIDPPNSRMSNRPRYVAKVERVTRTQFVVGGYRFRKDSGSFIGGDGWHFAHVYHLTPELLAEVGAELRYFAAYEKLYQLRERLRVVAIEINRTHDKHQLAETMEAAAADLAAAIAKLQEAIP